MPEEAMQQEDLLQVDPEEQTERKLVHSMALAVVAIVAGGILILAIRPWIQRFREQQAEQSAAVDVQETVDVPDVEVSGAA